MSGDSPTPGSPRLPPKDIAVELWSDEYQIWGSATFCISGDSLQLTATGKDTQTYCLTNAACDMGLKDSREKPSITVRLPEEGPELRFRLVGPGNRGTSPLTLRDRYLHGMKNLAEGLAYNHVKRKEVLSPAEEKRLKRQATSKQLQESTAAAKAETARLEAQQKQRTAEKRAVYPPSPSGTPLSSPAHTPQHSSSSPRGRTSDVKSPPLNRPDARSSSPSIMTRGRISTPDPSRNLSPSSQRMQEQAEARKAGQKNAAAHKSRHERPKNSPRSTSPSQGPLSPDIVKNQQLEISKANAALSEEHKQLMKKSPEPPLPKAEPAPAASTNDHTVEAQVVTEHAHVTTIEREPAVASPAGRGCVACKECVIL